MTEENPVQETPAQDDAPQLTPHQQFLGMLPEDLRENPTFTKFSGESVNDIVANIAKSYTNLEKLHGADKNAILKIPATEDDPAWNDVYGKLGRPDNVDGYEVSKYKENPLYDEKGLGEIAQLAYENGVSKKAFQAIVDKYYENTAQSMELNEQQLNQTIEKYMSDLKNEWGEAYEQKTMKIQSVLKQHATEDFKQLAADYPWIFDHPSVVKTIDNIVRMSSEDSGVKTGETTQGALTPAEARAQLAAFEMDQQKMKVLMTNGHPQREVLLEERQRLFKQAYPVK